MSKDAKILLALVAVFLAASFIPFGRSNVQGAFAEAFALLQEYARRHVLLCLIPAFFIAGAITVFIRQEAVIRYLGPKSNKVLAYGIASVSGTILAVCSCTVLPLFAGIYTRGAGIGPASAFLYSGPAINVLAITLTAKVLGLKLGLARALGAVVFSVVIGLLMHAFFGREAARERESGDFGAGGAPAALARPLWKTGLYFAVMIGILVFMNWGKGDSSLGLWNAVYSAKWAISGGLWMTLFVILLRWFSREEIKEWVLSTWIFTKQIFPLLLAGIFVAGFLLGRPGHEALIPNRWIAGLVGGNSVWANLFAAVSGALIYFCTLTEVPILHGLLGSGMGQGPALALLLAGPALSLPSIIVIRRMMGTKKALTYIALVVVMSTVAGILFGRLFG
ncbi:MAG: permease [Candidatus Aminicenantes bacterium]|nr:permease [Candidatus Aminicenantes bacterium]